MKLPLSNDKGWENLDFIVNVDGSSWLLFFFAYTPCQSCKGLLLVRCCRISFESNWLEYYSASIIFYDFFSIYKLILWLSFKNSHQVLTNVLLTLIKHKPWDTREVQSVRWLTLGFGFSHCFRVRGSSPRSGSCTGHETCLGFSLLLPLATPHLNPMDMCTLSPQTPKRKKKDGTSNQNKLLKNKNKTQNLSSGNSKFRWNIFKRIPHC